MLTCAQGIRGFNSYFVSRMSYLAIPAIFVLRIEYIVSRVWFPPPAASRLLRLYTVRRSIQEEVPINGSVLQEQQIELENQGFLSGRIWRKNPALPQKKRFLNEITTLICR